MKMASTQLTSKQIAGKRALLVVASAAMFHARLDPHLPNLRPTHDARHYQIGNPASPPVPFTDPWPPKTIQQCIAHIDPVQSLIEAWETILALDYKPVFETAVAALRSPPASPGFTASVKQAAQAGSTVAGNIAGLRHDLLGRVFHKVIPHAKNDGSYYTSTAAAILLTSIAHKSVSLPEDTAKYKVLDPACGTGTLLMAVAEHIQNSHSNNPSSAIGRVLIEDILHGYDINITATHLAATTLGLLSPAVDFAKMNINQCLYGLDSHNLPFVGSLELAGGQMQIVNWPTSVYTKVTGETADSAQPAFDLVIMNPPFTRDSLRYKQFSATDQRKLRGKEKQLFSASPASPSHSGGMFLVLGEQLTKSKDGTMAIVYPASSLGAPSAEPVWKHLLEEFWLETVITSHDPERISFSERTSISEILAVFRRHPDKEARPPTQFVNLKVNPEVPTDALNLADLIVSDQTGKIAGNVISWQAERVACLNWLPARFLSPHLSEKAWSLFCDTQSKPVFYPLGKFAHIGPDGRGIRGAFQPGSSKQGYKAMWWNNSKSDKNAPVKTSMKEYPDTDICEKGGKTMAAQNLWQQRGHLLIPTTIRLNTCSVVSVWCPEAVLGSAWVPVRHKELLLGCDWEKAMCVYLNSTVGILAQLSVSSLKIIHRHHMSLEGQRRIPVPDLKAEDINELSEVFDHHCKDSHQKLVEPDPSERRVLDRAVARILGINASEIGDLRRKLAEEPSVTAKRHTSVKQKNS